MPSQNHLRKRVGSSSTTNQLIVTLDEAMLPRFASLDAMVEFFDTTDLGDFLTTSPKQNSMSIQIGGNRTDHL